MIINALCRVSVCCLAYVALVGDLLSSEISQFGAGTTLTFAQENTDGTGSGTNFWGSDQDNLLLTFIIDLETSAFSFLNGLFGRKAVQFQKLEPMVSEQISEKISNESLQFVTRCMRGSKIQMMIIGIVASSEEKSPTPR